MAIEIIYYYKSKDPQSKVVGEFGVRIPEWGLTFHKMKLIRALNGNLFATAPSYKYTDKDGKEVYKEYWMFEKETGRRFFDSVLKAVKEHIDKTFGSEPKPEPQADLFA